MVFSHVSCINYTECLTAFLNMTEEATTPPAHDRFCFLVFLALGSANPISSLKIPYVYESTSSRHDSRDKGRFPLGRIFCLERNFLLFEDQLEESGHQKKEEIIVQRRKCCLVENGPNSTQARERARSNYSKQILPHVDKDNLWMFLSSF